MPGYQRPEAPKMDGVDGKHGKFMGKYIGTHGSYHEKIEEKTGKT